MADDDSDELHERPYDTFLDEVHSFQHWFDAVEGYLHGLQFGHLRDLPERVPSEAERERLISILCSYWVAEAAALETSSGLVRLAPNLQTKIFLSTQVADEGRHLEVVQHRLADLGVDHPAAEAGRRADRALLDLKDRLLALVDGGDWEGAIFAQNVVLEAMEFCVFEAHAELADPITRDMLERMVRDERRHMGFGENELARCLRSLPALRPRIANLNRELDAMALQLFEKSMERLGSPVSRRAELGRGYLYAVERLGID